jgi:hemolysin activation/secretion protein
VILVFAIRRCAETLRFGAWIAVTASATLLAPLSVAAASPPSPGAIENALRDVEAFYSRLDHQMTVPEKERTNETEEVVDKPAVQQPSASQTEQPAEAGAADRFWVSNIDISESQVLSRSRLSGMAEPLKQRVVGLDELNRLVEQINALYRERNFVTARAILPQQEVVDGVVRIQLIEARIDQVEVIDNLHTREKYITRRLGLAEGAFADVNALEDALLAFNAVNDVQLRALLQPGSRPHTTSYVLQAAEPEKHHLSVLVDNAGRETIGEERVGLTYTNNSLTGYRDRLSAGMSHADGTNAGYLVYGRPLNRFGTQATLGIDYSQIVVVSGELAAFGVEGQSTVASAFLSHPVSVTLQGSLHGLVGVNVKDSETDFDGVDRFESAVRTFSVGAEYQRSGNGYMLYARPRLNFGVKGLGGDSSFTTLSADAGVVITAAPSHQFAFRLRGQLSDEQILPSSEQFQMGGAASVRGFPEGLLIGDQGYFLSTEYRYLGFSASAEGAQAWHPLLFADHGGVFTSAAGRSLDGSTYLTSVGMGFSYRFSDKLTANFQVGFPLSDRPEFEDDYAVHFHINFMPF